MRPPSRRLAAQGRNHLAAGPRPSEGGVSRPGDPPPPAQARTETGQRDSGPAPPGGGTTHGGGAPQLQQAQPRAKRPQWTARTHPQYPLPTDNGTAAPRKAQTKRPTLRPAWGRQGRGPGREDLPPPPPRHTGPLAADQAVPGAHGRPATPTACVYPRGVAPET